MINDDFENDISGTLFQSATADMIIWLRGTIIVGSELDHDEESLIWRHFEEYSEWHEGNLIR